MSHDRLIEIWVMEYYREPGNQIQASLALRAGRLLRQYLNAMGALPEQVVEALGGRYTVAQNGAPFFPIFIMNIPLSGLMELAFDLANYLAQPTNQHWNGMEVSPPGRVI